MRANGAFQCVGHRRTVNGLRAMRQRGWQSETAWSWKRDLSRVF